MTHARTSGSTAVLMVLAMALPAGLWGCATDTTVTRVDPEVVIDLDHRFNDVDARQVYREMADDALFRQWIDRWTSEHSGQRPVIVVGNVRNDTSDYIDFKLFTQALEMELLNSGRVRVVAMRDQRGELRDERFEGEEWNTPETRKALKAELGADLMLLGRVADVTQRSSSGRALMKYYNFVLEMIDIESNEKYWIGRSEIKKVVR